MCRFRTHWMSNWWQKSIDNKNWTLLKRLHLISTASKNLKIMALNLSKHGSEMQRAWKQVCDANESTDWALYGYEGKKNNVLSFTMSWKFLFIGFYLVCMYLRIYFTFHLMWNRKHLRPETDLHRGRRNWGNDWRIKC